MQNEIKAPQNIFNEQGELNNPGWARKMYFQYNPENMKMPRMAAKEWDYYFIGNEEVGVAVTINDFGPIGMFTASLLKFKEKENMTVTAYGPGNLDQPKDDEGTCYFRSQNVEAIFIRKAGKHILKVDFKDFYEGKDYHLDLVLTVPETDRMVILTPFEENKDYFYFNEKLNCMRASGMVQVGDYTHTFSPEKDFAVLDLGRGVWPNENVWFWGSASGELEGKDFGFNIGYGFGDLSNATENMIFYDGVAHKFDQIVFQIPEEGYDVAPWHIVSNDGRFDMEFVPMMDRATLCDLSKGGSLQHQVFGKFNGNCVLDDGTVLEVKDFFGFAEEVHNNWNIKL